MMMMMMKKKNTPWKNELKRQTLIKWRRTSQMENGQQEEEWERTKKWLSEWEMCPITLLHAYIYIFTYTIGKLFSPEGLPSCHFSKSQFFLFTAGARRPFHRHHSNPCPTDSEREREPTAIWPALMLSHCCAPAPFSPNPNQKQSNILINDWKFIWIFIYPMGKTSF